MSYAVLKRRNNVKKYLLRGFTPREISIKVNESYFVICNDIRILKEEGKTELLKESDLFKDVLYQTKLILEKYKEIEKKAWEEIDLTRDPKTIAPLLTILKGVQTEVSKVLLLIKPSKTVINVNEFIQINIIPILKQVGNIIEMYVPEDQRYAAIVKLQELVRKTQIIEKAYDKDI